MKDRIIYDQSSYSKLFLLQKLITQILSKPTYIIVRNRSIVTHHSVMKHANEKLNGESNNCHPTKKPKCILINSNLPLDGKSVQKIVLWITCTLIMTFIQMLCRASCKIHQL